MTMNVEKKKTGYIDLRLENFEELAQQNMYFSKPLNDWKSKHFQANERHQTAN